MGLFQNAKVPQRNDGSGKDYDLFLQMPSLQMELDMYVKDNLLKTSSADNIMELQEEFEEQRLRLAANQDGAGNQNAPQD